MCTSYHVFPEENFAMRELISELVSLFPGVSLTQGRVRPSNVAPVLLDSGPAPLRFGLTLPSRKGLLLNARSETLLLSPLFAPMMAASRCLVPANDFYEWTSDKKARTFHPVDGGLLYMAGLCMEAQPLPCFVIITCAADEVVGPVHHRMPLLLGSAEYREAWLRSPALAGDLLRLPPQVPLEDRPAACTSPSRPFPGCM